MTGPNDNLSVYVDVLIPIQKNTHTNQHRFICKIAEKETINDCY